METYLNLLLFACYYVLRVACIVQCQLLYCMLALQIIIDTEW